MTTDRPGSAPHGPAPGPHSPAGDPPQAGRGFLRRVDPLVKLGVSLVAMAVAYLAGDPAVPAFLLLAAVAVHLAGTLPHPGRALPALAAAGLLLCWFTVLFALLASADVGAGTPIALSWGPLHLHAGALRYGALVAARIGAIAALSLLAGAGTTPEGLRTALVCRARVPYRFAHAALAGLQFVPVFRAEADHIRAAHRMRGADGGRGPLAAARRAARMLVPLLAGGIRHAERVSLAMDARGFGAHPRRTERRLPRHTLADPAYCLGALAVLATATTTGHALLSPVLPGVP